MTRAVLALDFDGVISDSARESYVVAVRTYAALRPRSPLSDELRPLLDGAPAEHGFEADPVFAAFREIMPLGNRAEDYAVILAIIESGAQVADQASYDAAYAAQEAGFLDRYHRLFYEVRRRFMAADRATWARLQRPYAPLAALLRRRAADAVLAIATAKDRESTAAVLAEYGLADLFRKELVLDKEAGVSKTAHLEVLRERVGCAAGAITFVDDKVNHLEAAAPLGVRCVLAAWGYNGERERRRAAALGFAVATLDDAEAILFEGPRHPAAPRDRTTGSPPA